MIVEPSSALRCWTSEYRTPRLPHLGQSVFVSIRSVCTWCLSTVWTIESFCRSAEGKSDGFVRVVTVFHGWSASGQQTNLCAPARDSRPTSVLSSAAVAMENILLAALGRGQKVAAVCAENQRPNCRHGVRSFANRNRKKKPAATASWDSLACPQSVVSQPNRCESFTAGSVSTTGGCCKSQSTAKIVRDRQDATPICPADPTPGGKARTMCSLGPSQKADLGIWGLAGARLQRDQPGD